MGRRPGESAASRQQRVYDFENDRSFADFVGDAAAGRRGAVRPPSPVRPAEMDEISAGAGIGYFSLVWNIGEGLYRRASWAGPPP